MLSQKKIKQRLLPWSLNNATITYSACVGLPREPKTKPAKGKCALSHCYPCTDNRADKGGFPKKRETTCEVQSATGVVDKKKSWTGGRERRERGRGEEWGQEVEGGEDRRGEERTGEERKSSPLLTQKRGSPIDCKLGLK